jgi:hypothetical protein
VHNCFNAFGGLGGFPLEPGQTSRGLRRRLGSLFRMTEQPTEYGATWVDLTQVAVPPAGVRAARFREAGKILSRMMKASVAPMPAGSLRTTGRSDLALLQHTVQIGVFLDFMQYPRPHWHLSISAVSGLLTVSLDAAEIATGNADERKDAVGTMKTNDRAGTARRIGSDGETCLV